MMNPFVKVAGIGAPLLRTNIDTDQITPGHTGMKVQKSGFGSGLFYNWRYLKDGSDNMEFVLNQPPYREACFLVAGANFGCGSSREFAVWALRDFGIRAVIAPSFGAIFTANCFTNGVLPITLEESSVNALAADLAPDHAEMSVDLENGAVISPRGTSFPFHVPSLQRERLLEGMDPIEHTLKREPLITAFQQRDAARRPWVYLEGGS
ncbi:MAG TPA: 3-isopropylmalate dehydratase small subunit [Steroidobacteraceae bacterium]|jgi:3-isopropylmalate/(R)-2-methylmalate dehydratase small subunit